ncbi:MAG: protein kinase, partial [Planctomycetota bacterium]
MTEPLLIELEAEIGAGATGRVWRARLTAERGGLAAGSEVALKRLHPELANDPDARRAFAIEAEAGLSVRHPGLVRVIQAGTDASGPYLLSEYVPGETLEKLLTDQGPLSEPPLRSIALQLAGGLAGLHAAGWIHGDIKPENMRMDARGRAVLLDLGFARRIVRRHAKSQRLSIGLEPGAVELAHAGGFNPGSLAYLAPERARGEAGDEKCDVFSLGVSLFELATGAHPFAADFVGEELEGSASSALPMVRSLGAKGADRLLAALASARYRPASRIAPQLSPFLDHVLGDALLRDPRVRPSAKELARRLEDAESGSWWRAQIEAGSDASNAPLAERESAHLTPLVGRESELAAIENLYRTAVGDPLDAGEQTAQLAEAFDPAGARGARPPRGGALWLQGPVGSGKSRLMSSFAARARASTQPPLYLYGRCSTHEEDRPCGPVLRLLLRWMRLPPQTTQLSARDRAALERVAPPKEAQTLARALDGRFAGTTETSVVAALVRWLILLSKRSPLVVFVDDVNFADEATLSVFTRVAEELSGKPLFLVLGRRLHDGVVHPRMLEQLERTLDTRALTARIELEPLDEQAVVDLVTRLFHHSAPRLRIAQVLRQRSRGNPGLIAEILRGLIQRGEAYPHGAEREDGALVLAMPPERLPLPESLPTLINQRYQKLPPEDRRWLQRLSIVG